MTLICYRNLTPLLLLLSRLSLLADPAAAMDDAPNDALVAVNGDTSSDRLFNATANATDPSSKFQGLANETETDQSLAPAAATSSRTPAPVATAPTPAPTTPLEGAFDDNPVTGIQGCADIAQDCIADRDCCGTSTCRMAGQLGQHKCVGGIAMMYMHSSVGSGGGASNLQSAAGIMGSNANSNSIRGDGNSGTFPTTRPVVPSMMTNINAGEGSSRKLRGL